jgi:hypothetical protein
VRVSESESKRERESVTCYLFIDSILNHLETFIP